MEEAAGFGEVHEVAAHLGVRVIGAAPQVAARRFDELDVGQAVEPRYFERAIDLFAGDGCDRPAHDRRVVGGDDALDARDDADAGDEAPADREVRAPAGERAEFEEGRILVEQQFDALADEELATLPVTKDGALAPACTGHFELGFDFADEREHALAVFAKLRAGRVDARLPSVHLPEAL